MIRKTFATLREMQRVTGPAITLLLVCLALVAFTSVARAQPRPQLFEPPVDVEAHAPAEVSAWITNLDGPPVLVVTVDAAAVDTYRVYLPGLELKRTKLRYDAEVGQHSGTLYLPANTPSVGTFTLRLVDQRGRQWDFQIAAEEPEPGC